MPTYDCDIDISFGRTRSSLGATLEYTYHRGSPAYGGARGEPPINPPEGAQAEFLSLKLDGNRVPLDTLPESILNAIEEEILEEIEEEQDYDEDTEDE